jgi:hypothetical protein
MVMYGVTQPLELPVSNNQHEGQHGGHGAVLGGSQRARGGGAATHSSCPEFLVNRPCPPYPLPQLSPFYTPKFFLSLSGFK